MSTSPKAKESAISMQDTCRGTITRFRLPEIPSSPCSEIQPAAVEWNACRELSPDLPAVNPAYATHRHPYVYMIVNRGKSTFFDGIVKFDTETKDTPPVVPSRAVTGRTDLRG